MPADLTDRIGVFYHFECCDDMYRYSKNRLSHVICFLVVFVLSIATFIESHATQTLEGTQGQGMTTDAGEEIVKPAAGFSAVVRLTDSKLQTLLTQGSLRINIPRHLSNSIRSVVIQRPIYFKEKRAVSYSDVELVANQIQLEIGSEVLQRVDYQPIELKFYESGINSIVLKYVGGPLTPINLAGVGDPTKDSPIVLVKLKSGKGIEGRLQGLAEVELQSQFGKIRLAMAQASRVVIQANGGVNVEMANGDLISGSIAEKKIAVLNRWDDETISLANIESITVRQPARILRPHNNARPVRPSAINPPVTQRYSSPAAAGR